jgi:7-cyano-7-deazaguanine reductase
MICLDFFQDLRDGFAPMKKKSIALSNERPDGEKQIREASLVRFANRTKNRRYVIEFDCPEFTCVCPASGFPDFATLYISYVPKDWCVELKSLKLYINQFRNQGVFHEDVVNLILDDLVKLLDPWEIEMVGDFNVRGNIKTVIRAREQHPKMKSSESLLKDCKDGCDCC